jgi:hypothetical protein
MIYPQRSCDLPVADGRLQFLDARNDALALFCDLAETAKPAALDGSLCYGGTGIARKCSIAEGVRPGGISPRLR